MGILCCSMDQWLSSCVWSVASNTGKVVINNTPCEIYTMVTWLNGFAQANALPNTKLFE